MGSRSWRRGVQTRFARSFSQVFENGFMGGVVRTRCDFCLIFVSIPQTASFLFPCLFVLFPFFVLRSLSSLIRLLSRCLSLFPTPRPLLFASLLSFSSLPWAQMHLVRVFPRSIPQLSLLLSPLCAHVWRGSSFIAPFAAVFMLLFTVYLHRLSFNHSVSFAHIPPTYMHPYLGTYLSPFIPSHCPV